MVNSNDDGDKQREPQYSPPFYPLLPTRKKISTRSMIPHNNLLTKLPIMMTMTLIRHLLHGISFLLIFSQFLTSLDAFQPQLSSTSSIKVSFSRLSSSSSHLLPISSDRKVSTCCTLYARKSTKSTKISAIVQNDSSQSWDRIKNFTAVENEIRNRLSSSPPNGKINCEEIRPMVQYMVDTIDRSKPDEVKILVHTLRWVATQSFSPYNSWKDIKLGLEMTEHLSALYSLTRSLCIRALNALNVLMRNKNKKSFVTVDTNEEKEQSRHQANAAFRILQRMCSGVGMQERKGNIGVRIGLDERDFAMVLNGYVSIGEMNMAHRVVGLQQRTPHAPPLSPVIYSIMIKGYGRLGDVDSVDKVFEQARRSKVDADIVMYNSLMDAYINCDHVPKAFDVFQKLTKTRASLEEQEFPLPMPNLRTYNTMLKGFVKSENMERALTLSKEMNKNGIWDAVTTNTLVGVAVATGRFEMAESILEKYTVSKEHVHGGLWHPNVEAYTELIGGYAKDGQLNKAIEIFRGMKECGVNPNEYTYTCIIGALAKAKKTKQAKKLLLYMSQVDGIKPSIVTYNALFTGMVEYENGQKKGFVTNDQISAYNQAVSQAMKMYQEMLHLGKHPNEITISTLVEALSLCQPSRIEQAKAIIEHAHSHGMVSKNNMRVATSLISACANSSDLEGALVAYRSIQQPDVVAFNALLKAFCLNGKLKMAIDILNKNLKNRQDGTMFIVPDVATYTLLISSLLAVTTADASKAAYKFYKEMKYIWKIHPDTGLIDA
jgi:pentatricopeptide repeat domain (PPR motif)